MLSSQVGDICLLVSVKHALLLQLSCVVIIIVSFIISVTWWKYINFVPKAYSLDHCISRIIWDIWCSFKIENKTTFFLCSFDISILICVFLKSDPIGWRWCLSREKLVNAKYIGTLPWTPSRYLWRFDKNPENGRLVGLQWSCDRPSKPTVNF
jgi:hypothetical protein